MTNALDNGRTSEVSDVPAMDPAWAQSPSDQQVQEPLVAISEDQKARELYQKLLKRSAEAKQLFIERGELGSKVWLNFQPRLLEAENEAAQVRLECLHCKQLMSALNPSRSQSGHIEKGGCKVYSENRAREAAASGAGDTEVGVKRMTSDMEADVLLEIRLKRAAYDTLQEMSRTEKRSMTSILEECIQQRQSGEECAPPVAAPLQPMATFKPQIHLRDAAIEPEQAALLYVDVQNYNCHPEGAEFSGKPHVPENNYWWQRMAAVKPAWMALQQGCRQAGVEVMYTVIQSLTANGRDRSMDYKISGFHVPPGSWDAQVLDCIQPGPDEIVIPKSSSSVFTTTNVDSLLRNMGVRYLLLAGCLTDQCVESAVRDACDFNYFVTLVTDACATFSQERHDHSCRTIKGYCRQRTSQQVLQELLENTANKRQAT